MANSTMFSLGSAFSKPETSAINYWPDFGKFFYPTANAFRKFSKNEQPELYEQYKQSYLGGSADAAANARIYQDYAKGLFANQPNQFSDYSQVGDYLYGKLDQFSNSLKDTGLKDMNLRLANLGIRPGSTGYDRLLNAQRITSGLAPAFMNTTNAIGRDYASLAGNDLSQTMLRLGLANDDALNRYMDTVYERPLNVADVRMNQLFGNNRLFSDLVNSRKLNTAGFETKETSDWAKGIGVVDNLLNGVVDLYMSYMGGGGAGGLGGMLGGIGGGGQGAASGNPYMDYLNQAGARINQGTPGNNISPYVFNQQPAYPYQQPYLGDVNVNPYLQGLS